MPTLRGLLHPLVQSLHRWAEWAGAIHPETSTARRFGSFGAGSLIAYPQASVFGEQAIHLGSDTLIGRHSTLSVGYMPGAPLPPESRLVIGDRCVIGARGTLTAHQQIIIEDDVWIGPSVFISDAGHGYQDPEVPIGRQMGQHQPVNIGAGSWIGHGAVILPGTTIGRHVVVGAGSVVRGTIPDHVVVAGVPATIIRRLEPGVGWVNERGEARPVVDFERVVQEWTQAPE